MDELKEEIVNEIQYSEDHYTSDFHSQEDQVAKEIIKQPKKIIKRKTSKTRPDRKIKDKELIKRPDFDRNTLERRFIQLKVNKMANKLYNKETAKDYRNLKSNFNLEMLNSKCSSFKYRYEKYNKVESRKT